MDVETARAKMQAQVAQAMRSGMAVAYGWEFEIENLTVYVAMKHRRRTCNPYVLRVAFDDFPRRAPSYAFVDPTTKQMSDGASPPSVMHSPGRICTPGTREFHEELHQADAQYRWDPERYPFLSTLQMIHQMMEQGTGG